MQHPVLDFLIIAIVITFFERHCGQTVYQAAREITLKFRSKLTLYSKEEFINFYSSVQGSIENVLGVEGMYILFVKLVHRSVVVCG